MYCAIIYYSHLCLETIYSNEHPLLGSGMVLIQERALIKKFSSGGRSFERGALSRGGAHSNKYGTLKTVDQKRSDFHVIFYHDLLSFVFSKG